MIKSLKRNMDILSKPVIITFIILVLISGYTIYNIYSFTPILEKCDASFKIIEKCECVPDDYLNELLGINYSMEERNYRIV